jgi:GPI mannosyltransferase 3
MVIIFGVIHQRAPFSVLNFFRSQNLSSNDSILFLTPCHSTPYYSYRHKNVSMRFLTCEPNLSSKQNYQDESDLFNESPVKWLDEKAYLLNSTYIVIYENSYENFRELLSEKHSICKRFFNSFIPITSRIDKYLIVLCKES